MSKRVVRRNSGKREALLAAGQTLFLSKGIRGVTVEEVVQAAGTSKATFYKYFADKSELVASTLEQLADGILHDLEALLQKAKRERLQKEDFLKIFDINQYDLYFQGNFLKDVVTEYPEVVSSFVKKYFANATELYRDLIRAAKIDGIVRMDVDTEVLISYTIILRRTMAESKFALPPGVDLREFTAKLWDLYLYGIMGKREEDGGG